ncbi:MAG: tRNA wyosine derivatives biosynthesis protein Taw2 [Candidatus Thorarchaeota archaeon]|nr:MAG: tRNA wyosine derivatives biosynthesis protein Taw2 [Candidatus Thorarchaeota archaeon]
MQFREFLKTQLESIDSEQVVLPAGYHVVGHVVLLHLDRSAMPYAKEIGEQILSFEGRAKSVAVRMGPTEGVKREPQYKLVAGSCNTTTTHIEAGVKFKLDPLLITFSGGNRAERIIIADRVSPKETVLDMFSCVGQFALHIAKRKRARVFAIEINKIAFKFLEQNIELNNVEQIVKPIRGDCRITHPKNSVNRVIMGYLHNTISYLPYAIEALKNEGGTIHMHQAIPKQEENETCKKISQVCEERGYTTNTHVRKIKNYAPGIEHLVFDIYLDNR